MTDAKGGISPGFQDPDINRQLDGARVRLLAALDEISIGNIVTAHLNALRAAELLEVLLPEKRESGDG